MPSRKDAVFFLFPLSFFLLLGCAATAPRRSHVHNPTSAQPAPALAAASSTPPPPAPQRPEVTPATYTEPPVPTIGTEVIRSENSSGNQLRDLHRRAAERYAPMDSYIVRLRRREQVNGKDKPEELLWFSFRKQPWSVYFKWLGPEGKGREVVYVKGRYEDKLHTLLAAGDMPLMPAGKRIALSPDNPLVRSASRHAITEAGIGVLIDRFGKLLDAVEQGEKQAGALTCLGLQKRSEYDHPLEAVEQIIPPGSDPHLSRGGRRFWFFDPANSFPVLIVTENEARHEVEYYCYDRFLYPVHLDAGDFDPDKLWGQRR